MTDGQERNRWELNWDEWLATLDPPVRERAVALRDTFARLGADEPEGWTRSEIDRDIPQLARFVGLRPLWPEAIDGYRDRPGWIDYQVNLTERHPDGFFADAGQALRRMLDGGISRDDICALARYVAYGAVFSTLYSLDGGYYGDELDGCPYPELMEFDPDGRMTGRTVGSLHESILSMDPSGREGRPA